MPQLGVIVVLDDNDSSACGPGEKFAASGQRQGPTERVLMARRHNYDIKRPSGQRVWIKALCIDWER